MSAITPEMNDAIREYEAVKRRIAILKEDEKRLRVQILQGMYGFSQNGELKSGTENLELGEGWKLKGEFKINYGFTSVDELKKVLAKIASKGNEGPFIADRLVKWKPELSVSEYNKLDDRYKRIVDKAIVAKNALPAVSLVPPKK